MEDKEELQELNDIEETHNEPHHFINGEKSLTSSNTDKNFSQKRPEAEHSLTCDQCGKSSPSGTRAASRLEPCTGLKYRP